MKLAEKLLSLFEMSDLDAIREEVISETNESEIIAWLEKAKQGVETNTKPKDPKHDFMHRTLGWTKGSRYFTVFIDGLNVQNQKSAYMFVDMEGNIYKAAGWKAPAKGIRGTITSVDPSKLTSDTGWLYK